MPTACSWAKPLCPPKRAPHHRRRRLIGRSVHSVAGAVSAAASGADFLLVGTMFATSSHPGAEPRRPRPAAPHRRRRRPPAYARYRRRHAGNAPAVMDAGRPRRRRHHQHPRQPRPRRRRPPPQGRYHGPGPPPAPGSAPNHRHRHRRPTPYDYPQSERKPAQSTRGWTCNPTWLPLMSICGSSPLATTDRSSAKRTSRRQAQSRRRPGNRPPRGRRVTARCPTPALSRRRRRQHWCQRQCRP